MNCCLSLGLCTFILRAGSTSVVSLGSRACIVMSLPGSPLVSLVGLSSCGSLCLFTLRSLGFFLLDVSMIRMDSLLRSIVNILRHPPDVSSESPPFAIGGVLESGTGSSGTLDIRNVRDAISSSFLMMMVFVSLFLMVKFSWIWSELDFAFNEMSNLVLLKFGPNVVLNVIFDGMCSPSPVGMVLVSPGAILILIVDCMVQEAACFLNVGMWACLISLVNVMGVENFASSARSGTK